MIVDDYSRYTWTRFLRSKAETPDELVVFLKMIQTKLNQVIVGIRSDHGTEFENSKLDQFCLENGTSHNFSAPRTPQQNGVVERKNRTLVNVARTMIIESNLPQKFLGRSCQHNLSCYHRCLIRVVLNKTLYELLNNRKPMLIYLRAFGCKCFVLNNGKDDLGKFDSRSDEGVFVGYSSSSKAYRIFNKQTQCIEESIHIVFDENKSLRNNGSNDEDDVIKLFKSQKIEGS